jgi:hypothetical protein
LSDVKVKTFTAPAQNLTPGMILVQKDIRIAEDFGAVCDHGARLAVNCVHHEPELVVLRTTVCSPNLHRGLEQRTEVVVTRRARR